MSKTLGDGSSCPCKWCGVKTTYTGTKECDRCHNITSSLHGMPGTAIYKILQAELPDLFPMPATAAARAHQLLNKMAFASMADWYELKACISALEYRATQASSDEAAWRQVPRVP